MPLLQLVKLQPIIFKIIMSKNSCDLSPDIFQAKCYI
jgi:hypothetical protein